MMAAAYAFTEAHYFAFGPFFCDCGGYGYMEEYRICRIYRDFRALSIFAGTSEIMKLIISKNLGLSPL